MDLCGLSPHRSPGCRERLLAHAALRTKLPYTAEMLESPKAYSSHVSKPGSRSTIMTLQPAKVFFTPFASDEDTHHTSTNPVVAARAVLFFAEVFFARRRKRRMSLMDVGGGLRARRPFFVAARYRLDRKSVV